MAKSKVERLLEKQIKQEKDNQRKREREARSVAIRERASTIVNGQNMINGFRIMDATSEQMLKCLLALDITENSRVSFTDDMFPEYVRMSLNIELEKLVQYGMIGGVISYDNGGWCYILPPANTYFEDKEAALFSQGSVTNSKREALKELINRGNSLIDSNMDSSSIECARWIQDVRTYNERNLKLHSVNKPLSDAIFFSKVSTIVGLIESTYEDVEFWKSIEAVKGEVAMPISKQLAMYDVFISHANKDKSEYVNSLHESLKKLRIEIFYDTDTLEWGDNWKIKILEGVEKAEFAIIVISESFFDREWTERELYEFLNRQNKSGQKIILPILHNITVEQLQEKYPVIADIQSLNSSKYTCDEIALLFAGQLIKRLKQ